MSKRSFAQTGFTNKNPRAMARTRRAVLQRPIKRTSIKTFAKLQSIEHKFKADSYGPTAISQSTSLSTNMADPAAGICIPVEGDDTLHREGRKITVTELLVKGTVVFAGAEDVIDTTCGQQVFLALIQDTQTNAAAPTSSDIYNNTLNNLQTTASGCLRNSNFTDRFRTLKTKLIRKPVLPVTQTAANVFSWPSYSVPFEFYHKFKVPIKVSFNATNGGTIADVIDNSFHMFASTGGDTLGTLTSRMDCTLAYNVRGRFYG